jgi:hypothetical protein
MNKTSSRKKTYHKNRCNRRIIAQFDGANGEHVTLFAHHAFSWYIMRSVGGETSVLLLPREEARKEYKRLKKVL